MPVRFFLPTPLWTRGALELCLLPCERVFISPVDGSSLMYHALLRELRVWCLSSWERLLLLSPQQAFWFSEGDSRCFSIRGSGKPTWGWEGKRGWPVKLCLPAFYTTPRKCQSCMPKGGRLLRWGAYKRILHTVLGPPPESGPHPLARSACLPSRVARHTIFYAPVPAWSSPHNQGSIYNQPLFGVAETRNKFGEDMAKLLCR